jgi:hypothetical protein
MGGWRLGADSKRATLDAVVPQMRAVVYRRFASRALRTSVEVALRTSMEVALRTSVEVALRTSVEVQDKPKPVQQTLVSKSFPRGLHGQPVQGLWWSHTLRQDP